MSNEHDIEPVPGLPERLPAGETLLWQGAPEWRGLARRVFHAGAVVVYFALLAIWAAATAIADGEGAMAAAASVLRVAVAGGLAFGLIVFLARAAARATLYTITDRRVVMRFGVAMPMTVNLPFSKIAAADLKPYGDGTGEIALSIEGPLPLAYWHLWPHCRPWYIGKAVPMLRCLAEPERIASILASAAGATAKPSLKPAAITEAGTPAGGLVAA